MQIQTWDRLNKKIANTLTTLTIKLINSLIQVEID